MKSIAKVRIAVSNEEKDELRKAKSKIDSLFKAFQSQGCTELDSLAETSDVIKRVLANEEFDGRVVNVNAHGADQEKDRANKSRIKANDVEPTAEAVHPSDAVA